MSDDLTTLDPDHEWTVTPADGRYAIRRDGDLITYTDTDRAARDFIARQYSGTSYLVARKTIAPDVDEDAADVLFDAADIDVMLGSDLELVDGVVYGTRAGVVLAKRTLWLDGRKINTEVFGLGDP